MSVGTALVAIKSANSALNTLIGTRFYPDQLDQGSTFPAVRYQVISGTKDNAMTPVIANNRYRVQMDGYETTSVLRSALRVAMINAFYGYSSASIGGESVRSILIDNEMEMIEVISTQIIAYRVSIDFRVDLA